MKIWPLHPEPYEFETLSSWLNRVALCYNLSIEELLDVDFKYQGVGDLDVEPPHSLLHQIFHRSGIELDRLHCMTLSGWVPWLLDSLSNNAMEQYTHEYSVLLPPEMLPSYPSFDYRPWLTILPINQACPCCIIDQQPPHNLIVWRLPIMLSCPVHKCLLEQYSLSKDQKIIWRNADALPRGADNHIVLNDARTLQALTKGFVDLPSGRVNIGLWFRLLRTIIQELSFPIKKCGSLSWIIQFVWEQSHLKFELNNTRRTPYEAMGITKQKKLLEASAVAIKLLEHEEIHGYGDLASIFVKNASDTKQAFKNQNEFCMDRLRLTIANAKREDVLGALARFTAQI